ncbi:MAG: DUF4268 domain-containing protein [Candidatus Poribacteria bacterium]|nr:DUF4268 domain-containing protein [Candidatus Poribacteria bacterium]
MANLSKSSRETQNIKYWTEFCDYLELQGSQLHSPTPTSKEEHYISFRIGIGCFLRARQVINSKYGPTAITVAAILKGRARSYFHLLQEQQEDIESEFGEPLEWFSEWKTESHIYLERKDMDPADEQDWSNQHEWIASRLERFNEVFRPRIERLIGFNK